MVAINTAILIIVGIIIGFILFFIIEKLFLGNRYNKIKEKCDSLLKKTEEDIKLRKKKNEVELKDELAIYKKNVKKDIRKEFKDQRNELDKLEKRLQDKESKLEQKISNIDKRDQKLKKDQQNYGELIEKIKEKEIFYQKKIEEISKLTPSEAKEELFKSIEKEIELDHAKRLKKLDNELQEVAVQKAQDYISTAVQKCALDHIDELTVSVVPLPDDSIKGRIIGREGRNIRAFEKVTGINLVIDDTPEAVVLSGFNPIKREIAKLTLETLIADGRIHPTRIEEAYKKAVEKIQGSFIKFGEKAIYQLKLLNISPKIKELIGRLKYRRSYGQNVLKHSIEVAYIAGILAEEIGLNAQMAKRAGLLHDIGKAVDQEIEGNHAEIGAAIAKRQGENSIIVNAIKAHHEAVPFESNIAILVQVADAISAAREGARLESLEGYIERLEELENLAKSIDGVKNCYALQAGREVRVMVSPNEVDDNKTSLVAKNITKKIEDQFTFPGEIKVVVIRETRTVEIAK